jgi:hypothetical protein
MNEEDTQYNIEDVIITFNGVPVKGLLNDDSALTFQYDEERYTVRETIDNAILGVFTNSKIGTATFTTSYLTKMAKLQLASLIAKNLNIIAVSIPNHITITLTSAGLNNPGTFNIGKAVNNQEIQFKGRLEVLPLGV